MSNGITLTSAMRNNLGALKYLSGQMDITQTRLATGQKVNSAIDNASSFYQARALTNRASDLDRLLDSMGQSIQTINAAISGLEHAGATLEQAAVVAQQAYEAAIIPEKAWFEAQVGPNGAVVSTAQELKDAVNSGKETICVYGKIDLGEITSILTLKDGQKLVGIGYFGNFDSEADKWSAISGVADASSYGTLIKANNNLIADLTLTMTTTRSGHVVNAENCEIHNIDIAIDNRRTDSSVSDTCGITTESKVIISGNSIIRTIKSGKRSMLLRGQYNQNAKGFEVTDGSRLRLFGGHINVYNTSLKIAANAEVYSSSSGYNNTYISHISLQSDSSKFIVKSGKMASSTYIAMHEGAEFIRENMLYKAKESFDEIRMLNSNTSYTEEFLSKVDVYSKDMDYDSYDTNNTQSKAKDNFGLLLESAAQYGEMMNVYDDMIKDSSYQGINLLTGGNLTTMFNETRSNSFKVEGANMTAESLGITTREWQTKEDIAQSIKEIKDAMYKVRDMVEVLGNNLSIIETRMNFTDALTDILQIGADELVLADMNEESANYLALQTRQQLAVNALSLAAQSSSAVLKLF